MEANSSDSRLLPNAGRKSWMDVITARVKVTDAGCNLRSWRKDRGSVAIEETGFEFIPIFVFFRQEGMEGRRFTQAIDPMEVSGG